MVEGRRHQVISDDGTPIGLLTAGEGPQLLLVHGGMGCIASWQLLWGRLTAQWQVTAMDRRGRESSGDTGPYSLSKEYADVAAVAASLAGQGPVDAFGHSFGATCVLGAAAGGAPLRRIALYEAGGPQTVPQEWLDRVLAMLAERRLARAMMSFLKEVIGVTPERIRELRDAPRTYNALAIMAATLPREAQAMATADLPALAAAVRVPAMLILGSQTPAWAADITRELQAALPDSTLAMLDGEGHEAIDTAPALITSLLLKFFG
jgi:pimeloyl-ACP methyl ester carboxylesterase